MCLCNACSCPRILTMVDLLVAAYRLHHVATAWWLQPSCFYVVESVQTVLPVVCAQRSAGHVSWLHRP